MAGLLEVSSSAASTSRGATYAGDEHPVADRDIKPRGFINLGASCWISAPLQALWAPGILKARLAGIYAGLDVAERTRFRAFASDERRMDYNREYSLQDLEGLEQRCNPLAMEGRLLSVNFASACSGDLTKRIVPLLLTDYYYQGLPEDAG